MGKKVFSTNGTIENPFKKLNLNPYLTPYSKLNTKWITDLNVKAETMKLLGENILFF